MRTNLPVLALALLAAEVATAACSGGGTQPVPDASIAGAWHLAATMSDTFSTARTSCTLAGNVTITQTGPSFTGQLSGSSRSCTGPGSTTGGFDGAVTGGRVVGDSLTFRTTTISCVYGGATDAAAASSVSGFINCSLPRGSIFAPFFGTFQLTR